MSRHSMVLVSADEKTLKDSKFLINKRIKVTLIVPGYFYFLNYQVA